MSYDYEDDYEPDVAEDDGEPYPPVPNMGCVPVLIGLGLISFCVCIVIVSVRNLF